MLQCLSYHKKWWCHNGEKGTELVLIELVRTNQIRAVERTPTTATWLAMAVVAALIVLSAVVVTVVLVYAWGTCEASNEDFLL